MRSGGTILMKNKHVRVRSTKNKITSEIYEYFIKTHFYFIRFSPIEGTAFSIAAQMIEPIFVLSDINRCKIDVKK